MKTIICILLFCISGKAIAQLPPVGTTWASNCTATPLMQAIYKNDVLKLAMDRVSNTNSPFKDSLFLPAIITDSIANSLYAIYNMPANTLKDTIVGWFGFSTFQGNLGEYRHDSLHFISTEDINKAYTLNQIEVTVPDTVGWAQQWYNGNYTNTLNTEINDIGSISFLSRGVLHINNVYFMFVNSSTTFFNTLGLADRFNRILNSNSAAKPSNYPGDGNSLKIDFDSNGMRLRYRLGCGDCPSGCTYGRIWKFKVYYTDCSVQYLGDSTFNPFNIPISGLTCFASNTVPLDLISFSVIEKNGYPALQWVSENERDVKTFEIQESSANADFKATGYVAANNTALKHAYNWSGTKPILTSTNYRLKMINADGGYKYSRIVQLTPGNKSAVVISPNPVVNKQLNIYYKNGTASNFVLRLYTNEGKLLFSKNIFATNGSLREVVILPAYISAGTYIIKVLSSNNADVLQQLVFVE